MGSGGGLELQVPVLPSICIPQIRVIPIIRETWGATAESEGTAVVKRESYGGGGSKGMEGVGRVVKLGCKWVVGLGNGV